MLIVRGTAALLAASVIALGCGGKSTQADSIASGRADGESAFGGANGTFVFSGSGGESASGGAGSGAESVGGNGASGAQATAGSGASVAGSSSSGGSGSSGASGTAGAESAGAAGVNDMIPCAAEDDYPPFECVTSCAEPNAATAFPVCDGPYWRCPGSMQSVLDCAPDACAVLAQTCCDSVLGNIHSACGPDGRVVPCAPGQTPNISLCNPANTPCPSLAGAPCALANTSCEDGRTACSCQSSEAGLTWMCEILPG
jgi:hypothetical protein